MSTKGTVKHKSKTALRQKRRKRKRRRLDERHEAPVPGTQPTGLTALQQRVGNRAVQHLLAQAEKKAKVKA